MTVKERDFAKISEDVEATIWRLREMIRIAELAATHRLGQMHRLLMHGKHKTWKREFGFDRIETAAEMDEKRSRTSTNPVPDPFFYRNMVIPRRPHTRDDFTLGVKMNVEGLRMEIILSHPASSQCDPSPRRAAVDTESEEPGAARASFKTSVCVCVFFPSILDIKFVGRTSRGHTGGRSHMIFNPPSFCGACLDFCREKDSAIPFPRRP